VFLEDVDDLDGFLLGLQHADDIDIGEEEGGERIDQNRRQALESREAHGDPDHNSDDLFEDEEDVEDVLFAELALVRESPFEQVRLIIIGHEY
jgi:hypothetical protein